MMLSQLGKLVPVFWLMELDLIPLKSSAVSSRDFEVPMGSACLWTVPLALAVLDASISTATSKWLSQHICTAAHPLLGPGITAGASVPQSCPALLGRGFCSSFLGSSAVPSASQRLVRPSLSPLSLPSLSQSWTARISAPGCSLHLGAYVHSFQLTHLCALVAEVHALCCGACVFIFWLPRLPSAPGGLHA